MADDNRGLKLNLHFNFEDIKKDLNMLHKKLSDVSKNAADIYKNAGSSIGQYSGKLAKINEQLLHQSNSVKVLSDSMRQILLGDITPKSITNLEKELEKAKKDFDKLADAQVALNNQIASEQAKSKFHGPKYDNADKLKDLQTKFTAGELKLDFAQDKIDEIQRKLDKLKLNPQLTPEFEALAAKLAEADSKMLRLQQDLKTGGTAPKVDTSSTTGKIMVLQQAVQKTLPLLLKVGDAAKTAGNRLISAFKNSASHIKIFNKDLKLGDNLVNKFMKRIKNMAINTFIFFQIRKAIRAMFASFADGFKQYAKFDKEFGNSIKNLKNTGVQLGNSIAAGFIPLIQALLPYLQQLVELMTKAADKMAQFTAALSGKQVYTKAKEVQDLKEGLDDVAESADAAKGSLAGFDQLNVQSMSKEDDTKDYFETAPIDSSILDTVAKLSDLLDPLLNKLKEMKLDLADAFKNVIINFKMGDWSNLLTPLTNLFTNWLNDIDWQSIQATAYKLGKTVAEILNSVFKDTMFADAIGHTIAELLNTALWFGLGFLTTFDFTQFGVFIGTGINAAIRDFDWRLLGLDLGLALNGIVNTALATLQTVSFERFGISIGESFTTWINTFNWENLGALLAQSLNSIVEFSQGFTSEYNFGNLGTNIANGLNEMVLSIKWPELGAEINKWITGLPNEIIQFLETTDWTMIGIAIGEMLSQIDIADILSKILIILTDLVTSAVQLLVGLLIGYFKDDPEGALKNTALVIAGVLAAIFFPGALILTAIIASIAYIITRFKPEIEKAWNEFKDNWAEGADKIITGIKEWRENLENKFKAAIAMFKAIIKSKLKEAAENIITGFLNALSLKDKAETWVKNNIVDPFIGGIKKLFGIASPSKVMHDIGNDVMQGMLDGISTLVDDVKEKFTDIKDSAVDNFNTLKTNISESVENTKNDFTEKWDIIKTAVSLACEDMQTSWNDTKDKLTEKASEMATSIQQKLDVLKNGAKEKFETLKSNIVSLFAALPSGIKDPLNNVITMVENLINRLIDGFNLLSEKLGTFKIDVPDWVPEIGGTKYSLGLPNFQHVSLPRIPALAQGTVIPPTMGEFIARLGDNNKETEIVSPLSTMKQAFMEALSEMDFSTDINVYLEGDADGVFRLVRTENNKWKKQHAGVGAF